MMKGRVELLWIFIFILFLSTINAFGQKESAIWYFGQNAGLDFREHFPHPLTDGQINSPEGVASVSDSVGGLLFYTDGRTVWNKFHGVIASGLTADSASTHAVTIIPNRSNPKKYFIFTTRSIVDTDAENYGGNYYIVDFTENPLGEILYDNASITGIPGILANSTEKFAAIPFMDEISGSETRPSYRLLMHQYETDSFAIFNLDSLVQHYRNQAIGQSNSDSLWDDGSHRGASGQIKLSLQGDRVAVALEGQKRFEVYDFNKETGELSNPIWLPAGDNGRKLDFIHYAYGVEFSPSGRYLYGSSRDGGWIYQWDLSLNFGEQMRARVFFRRNNPEINCGALQLAPNGKIYVAMDGQDYLGVINSPNNLDCEYEEFGARLLDNEINKGGFSGWGLPGMVPTGIKAEAFYYNHTCLGEKTSFYITNRTGLQAPFFAISDWVTGAPVVNVFSRFDSELEDLVWEHTFVQPGEYKVVLTAIRSGTPVQYTRKLTIHAPPESMWPRDTVICKGSQLVLDAGNGAFYDWVESTARDRHLIVDSLGKNPVTGSEYAAKEFRVAVTHYNGCVKWDTINVIRKFPPVLEYESTEAKCNESNGTATVIPNGAIENYTYTWEDVPEVTTNQITNIPGGDYRVFVSSNQTGCESFVDIPVNSQGSVKIIPSVDTLICPGTEVILTGTNADFLDWVIPEGGSEEQVTVYPEETTTYRLRGMSDDGSGGICETYFDYTVEVAPISIPDLGDDLSACSGDTIIIDGPDDYLEYNWSNGMSGRSVVITGDTDPLILYVKDTNQCIFSDEMAVTFYNQSDLQIIADKALCGKLNGSGSVIPEGNPDDYIFEWEDFPDNTTNKILGVGAGQYRVQITSMITGCDTIVELVINEFGAPDTKITASVYEPVCPGTEITLTAGNADYYIWDNPESSREEQIIIAPFTETTYTVMGASIDNEGNECRSFAEITIPVLPYDKPDIGEDLEACEGDTLILDGEDKYFDWSWSNGMTGKNILITTSDPELVLTAIDENQCPVSDTVVITFNPYPEVDLGEDQTICTNEPVILEGGFGDSYLWSTDENTQQIYVQDKGTFWLEISTSGCTSRDSVSLQLVNPDSIKIDSVIVKDISCFGEVDGEITIFASGTGDSYSYSIDGGVSYFDNDGFFDGLSEGDSYMISVLEDSVCWRDYYEAIVISEPLEIETGYQLTSPTCEICLDGKIEITLMEGGSPPYSILWDNQSSEIERAGIGTGSYSVNISDSRGCFTDLFFELDLSYRIPNAFTPNDDGVNDFWKIGIIEYHPDAIVKVYNSKGILVFESARGYPEPWDGKFEGEFVSMGTYYYLIYLSEGEKPEKGTVTILR